MFSKEELIQKYSVLEIELLAVIRENFKLRNVTTEDTQLKFQMQEQLDALRDTLFGATSERYKKPEKEKKENPEKQTPKPRIKKPSERYPNIPVKEVVIAMDPVPSCSCCGSVMSDSGMTEDSEQLTVIPKKYEVLLQKRIKYRCKCHGSIQTAAAPARIIEGSTYSDEMIQDVVLSKYCDLIPIEGLTLYLDDPEVPIDNNSQERLLRNHVIGRKTWYGTHSKLGAKTAATLFSLVETCKLNQVNPREYFKVLVQDLLAGKKPYTPVDFKKSH